MAEMQRGPYEENAHHREAEQMTEAKPASQELDAHANRFLEKQDGVIKEGLRTLGKYVNLRNLNIGVGIAMGAGALLQLTQGNIEGAQTSATSAAIILYMAALRNQYENMEDPKAKQMTNSELIQ